MAHEECELGKLAANYIQNDMARSLDDLDPEGSVQRVCSVLQDCCCNSISQKVITTKAASHPWLDDACFAAVAAKAAANSSEFAEAARHCCEVLRGAFLACTRDLREHIVDLPKHSKIGGD